MNVLFFDRVYSQMHRANRINLCFMLQNAESEETMLMFLSSEW